MPAQGRVNRIPSQPINWVWWHVPVILPIRVALGKRIMVQAGSKGKKERPYLKNN
jgi:hypothetical protein